MTREQIETHINRAIFDITNNKLRNAGLPIPSKPSDENIFNEWDVLKRKHGSISSIPFSELGEFLDRWTALVAYTRWTEAVADIEQQTSREIRDTIKKQLYNLQSGTREAKDAGVYTEDIYVEWQGKYNQDFSLYTAVRGLRECYEQRLNSISREITRRSSTYSDASRQTNRGLLG